MLVCAENSGGGCWVTSNWTAMLGHEAPHKLRVCDAPLVCATPRHIGDYVRPRLAAEITTLHSSRPAKFSFGDASASINVRPTALSCQQPILPIPRPTAIDRICGVSAARKGNDRHRPCRLAGLHVRFRRRRAIWRTRSEPYHRRDRRQAIRQNAAKQ